MKLWLDDVREAPEGYVWLKSVNEAIAFVEANKEKIELIDTDHDAGDFADQGGDYIRFLDYLAVIRKGETFAVRIHSMNPVGRDNMRRIISRNNWIEVF